MRIGTWFALLFAALSLTAGADAAPAAESTDAVVKRINDVVSHGYWQRRNIFILSAGASLGKDGLGFLVTRCADYHGEPVQQFMIPCTLEAISIAKSWYIHLGEVDASSIAVRDPVKNQEEQGGVVTFACREDSPCVRNILGQKADDDLLVCENHEACERLKQDFAALVNRTPQVQLAPKPLDPVDRVLTRMRNAIADASMFAGDNLWVAYDPKLTPDGKQFSVSATMCQHYDPRTPRFVARCKASAALLSAEHSYTIDLTKVDPASFAIADRKAPEGNSFALTFSCADRSACVADMKGETPGYDLLLCADRDACNRLKADFASLITRASATAPVNPVEPEIPPQRNAPQQSVPPQTPQPKRQAQQQQPQAQTVAGMLDRINGDMGRALYWSGRNLLVSTALKQSPDGRFELDGHLCVGLSLNSARADIEKCRASNPSSADTRVLFRTADLDRTMVHMEDNAGTFRVLFLCREKNPCVARPDKSAYFPGGFIACPGRDACNRLMSDFFQLIDLAARQPRANVRR